MSTARKLEWQRRSRAAFAEKNGFSTTANAATGGNRAAVLMRDGCACVKCGMTDEQHKARWGRPITIDHISKDRSDNSMANLQTLCLECHGRKDLIPRLRARRIEVVGESARALRAQGKTYQQIADALGFSLAGVWKFFNISKRAQA